MLGKTWVVEDALQHSGHQECFVSPFIGDGVQHSSAVELAQDDVGGAALRSLQDRR
ncbi:hypothetical protein D3C78_1449880 [compost metagenome]